MSWYLLGSGTFAHKQEKLSPFSFLWKRQAQQLPFHSISPFPLDRSGIGYTDFRVWTYFFCEINWCVFLSQPRHLFRHKAPVVILPGLSGFLQSNARLCGGGRFWPLEPVSPIISSPGHWSSIYFLSPRNAGAPLFATIVSLPWLAAKGTRNEETTSNGQYIFAGCRTSKDRLIEL